MAPLTLFRSEWDEGLAVAPAAVGVARMNQATRRHCRFGPKSAPRHRDFEPKKVGVI